MLVLSTRVLVVVIKHVRQLLQAPSSLPIWLSFFTKLFDRSWQSEHGKRNDLLLELCTSNRKGALTNLVDDFRSNRPSIAPSVSCRLAYRVRVICCQRQAAQPLAELDVFALGLPRLHCNHNAEPTVVN